MPRRFACAVCPSDTSASAVRRRSPMRTAAVVAVVLLLALGGPAGAADKSIEFSIRAAHSGAWSDPATWAGGRVPAAGDTVQVRPGHAVTYDVRPESPTADQPIRTIHVAGVLRFSHDVSTRLTVGLIKITPGETCSEDGFACHSGAAAPMDAVP